MTLIRKSGRLGGLGNEKGETTTYAVVLGFLIAVLLFVVVKYFHDRNNDITIHLPRVEVH
jgi:low temperature requirement protein LtrA